MMARKCLLRKMTQRPQMQNPAEYLRMAGARQRMTSAIKDDAGDVTPRIEPGGAEQTLQRAAGLSRGDPAKFSIRYFCVSSAGERRAEIKLLIAGQPSFTRTWHSGPCRCARLGSLRRKREGT